VILHVVGVNSSNPSSHHVEKQREEKIKEIRENAEMNSRQYEMKNRRIIFNKVEDVTLQFSSTLLVNSRLE